MAPNQWPLEDRASLNAFYGKHQLRADGFPTAAWVKAHLTIIDAPYPMTLSWEPAHAITRIQCHRAVAPSLRRILSAILQHYGSLSSVKAARMHLYGGVYNYRPIAGSHNLSLHAYGAAIDLDPEHNPLGRRWLPDTEMMPEEVVAIFEAEGWKWGGRFQSRADCMHFQATS
jgi:hypothetical protein